MDPGRRSATSLMLRDRPFDLPGSAKPWLTWCVWRAKRNFFGILRILKVGKMVPTPEITELFSIYGVGLLVTRGKYEKNIVIHIFYLGVRFFLVSSHR